MSDYTPRYVCHASVEVENAETGETQTMVCTMTRLHESHRSTFFWSPTSDEVDAMLAADEQESA